MKLEKPASRFEVLLTSDFWQYPIFGLLKTQLEKVIKKLKETGLRLVYIYIHGTQVTNYGLYIAALASMEPWLHV
jgi:hypothetical protein